MPTKAKPRRSAAHPPARPAKPDLDLLRALSNTAAVSGDEGAVRRLVLEAIRPHVDEVKVDALGNVLAVKHAARGRTAPRLLLAAHMDEVGLMIVDHDSDGSLRFEVVGGVNERVLLGKPVIVGPRRLPGVIGAAPRHLLGGDRLEASVRAGQMRIDLGAASQDAARRQVALGERATFATEFAVLDGAVRGKALDDRLGCATLIGLLRGGPYPVALHAAFTVQEEVGLRGARVAGYAVEPQAASRSTARPPTICPIAAAARTPCTMPGWGRGPSFTWPTRIPFPTGGWWTMSAAWPKTPACPTKFASRAAAAPMPAPSSRRARACPSCRCRCRPAICTARPRWPAPQIGKTRSTCWR